MTAIAKTQRPPKSIRGLTRIIAFIRYVRILIWLPCPRVTFYYAILERRSYTREDMRLHTLISCILDGVEKRSAVLENVLALLDETRIYVPVTKWRHWGMFIHWRNKLRTPPNAVRILMYQCRVPRGSDTSARPRV